MITALFWLLLLLAAYSYFVYPILLAILRKLGSAGAISAGSSSSISMTLIVTAYNEQERIREKIENTLAVDYPGIELIVASDCSADATDDIVREYVSRGVRLVRAAERLGKENAQLCAIREARGEVLVFSDVATRIPPDALRKLAVYFQDVSVGAVSSEDRFITQGDEIVGEGAYVRYEMWLRRMESQLGGIVGLSGSFFAARARVCQEWDIHSPSDFNTALNCARQGLRAVTAPDVLGFYKDLKDPKKEYQRKVRTALRGMTAIARHPDVLNPWRFGLFAWQVWSHKLMRWAVPWLLLCLFVTNLAALEVGPLYVLAFSLQIVFYATALLAHCNQRVKDFSIARIVYFFVQVNVAIGDAFRRFLTGKRMTTWMPSAR